MSKILKLSVENIKRVKAIEITPDGSAVIISGKNGQGKSSTLDAIEMVLGGKDAIPSMPVRNGKTQARIVCETDKYIITRHWTDVDKTYLKVEMREEGAKLTNPQSILDNLVGDLSFDPLEFSTMEPAKQLKMLKDISKLDFSELDKEYKQKFEQRRDVKRDGEHFKATVDSYGVLEVKEPAFALADLQDEIAKAKELNAMAESNRKQIEDRKGQVARINQHISDTEDQIKNLQARLQEYKASLGEVSGQIIELEGWQGKTVDMTQFDAKIQEWNVYEANKKIIDQKKAAEEKLAQARTNWQELDNRLKEIDETKKKMIAEANMPINGLSLGEGEVLYNGIPFIQLSTSEQIRVSMAIAMALNPRLKVVLIKNGSLLDGSAMKELERIASDKGFQVWIERVADTPDGKSIFIEDGEVKA